MVFVTHILIHSLEHALEDSLTILPFLFITYFVMELLEERTGEKTNLWLQKAGKLGPVFGGILGVIPQCGISAVAANLYAGRIISVGTLMAVFLSTSDEMLPVLIANGSSLMFMIQILVVKIFIGILAGIIVDYVVKIMNFKQKIENKIHDFCEHEHCHCEDGVVKSAIRHTIKVFLFVFIITFVFNLGIETIGEEVLTHFIINKPVLGPIFSAIVGLLPNCAASIIITQMYIEGMITFGTLLAGVLTGAGVGVLVLLRVNEKKAESIKIISALYLFGVFWGVLFNFL